MTLIELVVVILLLGILGTSFGLFIVPMVNSYNAQVQRAALVDAGESALRRMARDIRSAVPNSVRISAVGSGFALELVPTVDGARFCATGLIDCGALAGGLSPTDRQVLDVTSTDSEFDIIGCFQDAGFKAAVPANKEYRLVVGNKSSEVYADTGSPQVITPSTTQITLSTDPSAGTCGSAGARQHVTLNASHKFCPDATADDCNSRTPRQRVFVVQVAEAPVTYICTPSAGVAGTLTRYWKYTFNGTQPTGAPAGSSSALVGSGISACSVNTASDIQNTGIAVIGLTLTDGHGETVSLLHQAQIDNSQ